MKKIVKLISLTVVNFVVAFSFISASSALNVQNESTLTTCVSANNECVLTDNIVLTKQLEVSGDVKLDLHGHSIKPDNDLVLTQGLIVVLRDSHLTVNDSGKNGMISTGTSGKVYGGIQLVKLRDNDESKKAKLTINGGVIEGYWYAVVGVGNLHNTEIVVNGGTLKGLKSNGSLGIYHPQDGTLVINGGKIIGATGVEIRAGDLKMTGGTITGTGVPSSVLANGNGSTTDGVALAISQHTSKKPINVLIEDGYLQGFSAVYESNPEKNSAEDLEKVNISITGGTFEAINGGTVVVFSENKTRFITGGTFYGEMDPSLIKLGYKRVFSKDGSFTVMKDENSNTVSKVENNIEENNTIESTINTSGNNHQVLWYILGGLGILLIIVLLFKFKIIDRKF